ncbi:MAG: PEP-CTERM sorting domain-containing protein [Emcibacter sp.]|nr:PEP-CTERM sorting domain-containing protein [Emcibacter sp.]
MTDLQADGMLSVDIFSSLGDFNLQSLSLTFTASQNQSVQTTSGTSNQVPEPGTLALLGLGLMGVAGYRRRRRS